MAESLLLSVVSAVVGKATDALVQKVTAMWGVDGDRRDLELKLLYVQPLLADAEGKSETNPAVKAWMRELKAAAYQADDVLDDFQYEALHREALSLLRPASSRSKVLDFFSSKNRLVFRHKVSRELKKVLGKIDKLVEDMEKFHLHLLQPPEAPYRQTHSALDDSWRILGRDEDMKVVVKLLLDQVDQRNVLVLPITGMGGLGKTTLAKMVYNDPNVQEHFDLLMWHCVSQNFEAVPVVRSIIQLAKEKGTALILPDTIELLRKRLEEVIGLKRFLLILDDVWNDVPRKWEDDLKPILCSSIGGPGSTIVVTSRSEKVASIMGTLPPYKLACLSEDDSWELFSKKAFSRGLEVQEEFVTIGRLIVNKCKGLPLALKTMGGLMSSKHQLKEWEAIAQSDRGGNDEVLSILKLSYTYLPSEMKQCLAFCAVFPKGYEMEKDKLIQLWMANNFIHAEESINLAEKGEFVFNELVWRSFIQDVNTNIFDKNTLSPYKEIRCKMHDLMHDLAKDVTDECVFAEELIQQKVSVNNVRHMQLSWYEFEEITRLIKNSKSLRTLLTRSMSMDLKALQLTSLRAICCPDPSVIHTKVISKTHLRYLDLSGSEIVRLPNSVCMLYNLQSLILNHCHKLQLLPEGIQTMRKLTHIHLLGCGSLKRMPPKLGLLRNLCTLTKFIVDIGDGFGIEEIKDLRHIGDRLELFNLRKVQSGSKANLHEKKNLIELFLYWGRDIDYNPLHDRVITNNEEEVLESLVPHVELKTLGLYGYAGLSISQWMRNPRMFRCLRELYISNCPECKDLPLVWLSPSLEKLRLRYMKNLTTLCSNTDMEAEGYNTPLKIFPKLKTMRLAQLPQLERWSENSAGEPNNLVMFPELEELFIVFCNKIVTLPECPALTFLCCGSEPEAGLVPMSMPLGSCQAFVLLIIGMLVDVVMPANDDQNQNQRPIDTLRRVRLDNYNGFISVFNSSKLQHGLGDYCLSFVEELEIFHCHNIFCWPLEEFQCLVRLRFLHIDDWNELEGKGSSSEEILPLPRLERLKISSCASLLEIPNLPVSLEKMQIFKCDSLVALPSNLGDLPKLRSLELHCCPELKALPDGMDGLKSLHIDGCPDLQRDVAGKVGSTSTWSLRSQIN